MPSIVRQIIFNDDSGFLIATQNIKVARLLLGHVPGGATFLKLLILALA